MITGYEAKKIISEAIAESKKALETSVKEYAEKHIFPKIEETAFKGGTSIRVHMQDLDDVSFNMVVEYVRKQGFDTYTDQYEKLLKIFW